MATETSICSQNPTGHRALKTTWAFALVIGAALAAGGCSSAIDSAESVTVSAAMPMAPGAALRPEMDTGFNLGSGETATAVADSAWPASGLVEAPAQANREIIMTGWAEIQADDPAQAASALTTYVESMGGMVSTRREWRPTPNNPGGAQLSLRVPAGNLNGVIEELARFGQVQSVDVSQMDVTAQGQDLDARIGALQTSITRLTELMANAGEVGDLLHVERELSSRQAELDSLVAARADLTSRVQMSTLEVNISATPAAQQAVDPPRPGFAGGLERGWRAFVGFLRGLAMTVGALLPWLIAVGVVMAVLTPIIRAVRNFRAKRRGLEGVSIVPWKAKTRRTDSDDDAE